MCTTRAAADPSESGQRAVRIRHPRRPVLRRILRADIRFDDESGIFVASGLRSGFARGGTTLGGVYLTRRNTTRSVLRHEAVHADQWARYGIIFGLLYLREELRHRGPRNRFEIEAGLEDGGYRT